MSASVLRPADVIRASLCAVLGLALAQAALADDSSLGATPGVFISIPPNSVTFGQANVQIKGRQVTLSLRMHGLTTDKTGLLLKGELFGWLGESETYPDRHFPELRFAGNNVDHAPVQPSDSFAAYVGKTDISSLLVEAAIDPWLIADTPPFVPVAKIKPEILEKLLSLGALKAYGADYLAQWRAQRLRKIEAFRDQVISISYDLRPAYALWRKQALTAAALRKRYCFTRQQLDRALAGAAANTEYVAKEITIPLGVDGRSPSALRLGIKPESGVVFVASCTQQGVGVAGADGLTDVAGKTDQHGYLNILTIERVEKAS